MTGYLKIIAPALVAVMAVVFPQGMAGMAKQVKSEPKPVFENSRFVEDLSAFPNPERGWYRTMETGDLSQEGLMRYRNANITFVGFETYLGEYLTRPLDAQKLAEVDRAFTMARAAGLSVIFRAAYDFDGKTSPDPKDMEIILNHIRQLGPVFQKHADILFNVQAGFLGPWGEWHSSYYGAGKNAPVRPEAQRQVANALLEAIPETTTVAVRRPEYIRNIAGRKEPVTAGEAFGNSKIARLAFHNDALMSERTDMDTYIDPDFPLDDEFKWINSQTRYTPFIGETNKISAYNDVKRAIPFLDLMNAHSLNIEYHPGVLKKWKNGIYHDMNAYEYITMMLGYRFVLKEVKLSGELHPGGTLRFDMELMNTGFGHLLREKKFELVFIKGSETIRAAIDEDARLWNKNELIERTYFLHIPEDISPGNWDVYIGLESSFPSLANNPDYSVRFANKDVWDGKLGLNKIGAVNLAAGK